MAIPIRRCVQSILPYIPGKSADQVMSEQGLAEVIKLASNENPMPCPIPPDCWARWGREAAIYPSISTSPLLETGSVSGPHYFGQWQ
jgi:histidinol-phosphate aminotransferase